MKAFSNTHIDPFINDGITSGDGMTGHFTQVVWASTKKVGCGFVRFINKDQEIDPGTSVVIF